MTFVVVVVVVVSLRKFTRMNYNAHGFFTPWFRHYNYNY